MNAEQLKTELKGKDSSEVTVSGVVEHGEVFKRPLTYFEGDTINEMVDDLFQTMELNPPAALNVEFDKQCIQIY